MSRTIRYLSVLALCVASSVGCGLIQTTKEATRETSKMFRPKANDFRDTTSESQDQWSELGESARAMRPSERANDPLRKFILSPKAQSIERNLGVD